MKKVLGLIMFFVLFVPFLVMAQTGINDNTEYQQGQNDNTDDSLSLRNPLGDIKTPQALVGQVINSLFGIVGSLALVMFIYGGFLWMTSAGSSEQVKKGKDIFIWAVVGLVVIFSAYSLVRFVIQGVGA